MALPAYPFLPNPISEPMDEPAAAADARVADASRTAAFLLLSDASKISFTDFFAVVLWAKGTFDLAGDTGSESKNPHSHSPLNSSRCS